MKCQVSIVGKVEDIFMISQFWFKTNHLKPIIKPNKTFQLTGYFYDVINTVLQ